MMSKPVFILLLFFLFAVRASLFGQETNLALHKPATVSSEDGNCPASNITDGRISRNHAWMSHASSRPPHQATINLKQYCDINRIVIYSGIPEKEKKNAEKGKAPGFWSIKNLKMQYWDDANWTDLPQTEIYENRRDTISFVFQPALTTFQVRLLSTDGEPIRINEIEVFGAVKKNMPLPDAPEEKGALPSGQTGASVRVVVDNRAIGKSMKYVAYNQGYYMPGYNVSDWLRYANVNSLRIWTALNEYVPVECVSSARQVTSLSLFEANKKALRDDPEGQAFIRWDKIDSIGESVVAGTNTMVFRYALEETKRLGIDVVLQMNGRDFDETWSNKWQQWQRYYALAYYAAKNGDVRMFATQNEPNHRHSGPMTIEGYLSALRIVSDAVRCAVEDVNKRYGKDLKAQVVAPVTAGANTNWWAEVMKNVRTHYSGQPGDRDLIDLFSTHAYNLPAQGYATKVSEIRDLIVDCHPLKRPLPIVFTETGRWMNAYLIDKYETMDSPSLFTEWAGEYANNTLNGCYGMWAFKMANTASKTYPRGIKSGHHLAWQGRRIVEDAYVNLAKGKKAIDLSSGVPQPATLVCDGDKSDRSAWLSPQVEGKKCLEIDLGETHSLGGAVVYTGSEYGVFTGVDRVKNFKLQYLKGSDWIDIDETVQKDAKYVQSFFIFDAPLTARKVRFLSTDEGSIAVREIKLFDAASMRDIKPSFGIGGIHRTGEVVRLFAKGFKNERPLLKVNRSSDDRDVDILASHDEDSDTYYMWLTQRKLVADTLTIDLSALPIEKGARVIAEEVSGRHYGDVVWVKPLEAGQRMSMLLPAQSVTLLAIPARSNKNGKELYPVADASVRGGRYAAENNANATELEVEMNAGQPDNNRIAYVRFDLGQIEPSALQAAVLNVAARASHSEPYRLHVYAVDGVDWQEDEINWNNAPRLDRATGAIMTGADTFLAGQMVAGDGEADSAIDVTQLLRRATGRSMTFIFIRELRELGDDGDNGKRFVIRSRESERQPVLTIW